MSRRPFTVPLPVLAAAAAVSLAISPAADAKSAKRGIAYDLSAGGDFSALSSGVSWWYNWASTPNASAPADAATRYGMDYYPMLWNDSFDDASVVQYLQAHPTIHYLMVLNEPNVSGQAYMTPQAAAASRAKAL